MITLLEEFERNRKAVMELPDITYEENSDYRRVIILEECTCLPDLPDGRSRGHCLACEADSQREEIPWQWGPSNRSEFGGE